MIASPIHSWFLMLLLMTSEGALGQSAERQDSISLSVGDGFRVPGKVEDWTVEGHSRGWRWMGSEGEKVFMPLLPGNYEVISKTDKSGFAVTVLSRVPKGARATVQPLREPWSESTGSWWWAWLLGAGVVAFFARSAWRAVLSSSASTSLQGYPLIAIENLPRGTEAERRHLCHQLARWGQERHPISASEWTHRLERARFSSIYPSADEVGWLLREAFSMERNTDSVPRKGIDDAG